MYTSEVSPENPVSTPDDLPNQGARTNVPENYYSELPIKFGILFGIAGSLLIIICIAGLTLAVNEDVWRSPRFIASVLLGESAYSGAFPILLGTVIHLASGAIYGAIFAYLMPRMPRPFWIVAGLLYGIIIWGIAVIVLSPLVEPVGVSQTTYFNVLIISHLLYGINLGAGGATMGLFAKRG